MKFSQVLRESVRQAGYAIFSFGGLSVLLERLMTGFVTPYFNPYLLVTAGLVLMLATTQNIRGTRRGRLVVGGGLWLGLSIWMVVIHRSDEQLLRGGVLVLLATIFFVSVYFEDV